MIAKGNKRKSLANHNEPPSKSPKVKNNTPAKLAPAKIKTPQVKPVAKGNVQKQNAKKKIPVNVQNSDDDEDDEEMSDLEMDEGSIDDLDLDKEDIGDASDNSDEEEGSDDEDDDEEGLGEEDSEDEVEGSADDDDDEKNVDSDEDEEEDNLEGANGEEDSNDEEKEKNDKATDKVKQPKPLAKPDQKKGGKQRYVLFVGNIPYTCTTDVVREHFKDVGPIIDVRMVTHRNQKPKGFCFIEFQDSQSYEKALSLHHSFLSGRRINVEYSAVGGKADKKKVIQKKNFKLQALQKLGKLEGGVNANQKRGARRAKANMAKKQKAEED